MTPALASAQQASADVWLERDGYAVLDLLAAGDIDRLRAEYERFAGLHRGPFAATLLIADAQARSTVHHAVGAVMAPLLAAVLADYRAVFCGFAVKEPCARGGEMPLHQDISFSRPQGRASLSVWAPLVEVTPGNGCLVVVPGSQRFNCVARAPGSPGAAAGLREFQESGMLRELPLRPGQAVVMHQGLLHASPGNRSTAARVAATAVAVPREEALRYYHRITGDTAPELEGFTVPDDFFLSHRLGCRPQRGASLGTSPETVEIINPGRLAA
jgi:hypothetical protein